jgi:hypothetical protein
MKHNKMHWHSRLRMYQRQCRHQFIDNTCIDTLTPVHCINEYLSYILQKIGEPFTCTLRTQIRPFLILLSCRTSFLLFSTWSSTKDLKVEFNWTFKFQAVSEDAHVSAGHPTIAWGYPISCWRLFSCKSRLLLEEERFNWKIFQLNSTFKSYTKGPGIYKYAPCERHHLFWIRGAANRLRLVLTRLPNFLIVGCLDDRVESILFSQRQSLSEVLQSLRMMWIQLFVLYMIE